MFNFSRPVAAGGAIVAGAAGIAALYAGTNQFSAADTNKTVYGQAGSYAGQDTVQSTTEGLGVTLMGIGAAFLATGGALGHKAFASTKATPHVAPSRV